MMFFAETQASWDTPLELANYWLILLAVYGAVVGSFLNVVIFRLPRGLSVASPRWSFCPACQRPIRFRHNIPIISWLLLRGRCRYCSAAISVTYPIIECATLLLFVAVWDAMATSKLTPGMTSVGTDWPLILAHLILFAALLAGSAMDIESYIIDIRVCLAAVLAGVLGHGLWWALAAQPFGMPASRTSTVIPPALCLIGAAMGAAWLVTHLLLSWWSREPAGEEAAAPTAEAGPTADGTEPAAPPTAETAEVARRPSRVWPIIAFSLLTLALLAWQCLAPDQGLVGKAPPVGQRGFVACFLFMLVLVLASMVPRPADAEIVQEIEAERSTARRAALGELLRFAPAILLGVGLLIGLRGGAAVGFDWPRAIDQWLGPSWWAALSAGALHSLAAAVLSAAIGWTVRIVGTLAFGKEAFGTGDIYIMGAIGAVGGLPFLVFAFFLGAVLALIGVLVTAFHKRSRAIPFGPWLALGAFVGLWLQPALLSLFLPAGSLAWSILSGSPLHLR